MSTAPRTIRLPFTAIAVLVAILGCADNTPPSLPTRQPVAMGPVEVTAVGDVVQGDVSAGALSLRFTEASPAGIRAGAGSFQLTLTDHAGVPDTIEFTGTPSVMAPGSLGASAILTRANVLTVAIVDSDSFNVEQLTITGLGIRASPTAALGSINGVISGCAGSLAGCTTANVLASPGSVVAAQ